MLLRYEVTILFSGEWTSKKELYMTEFEFYFPLIDELLYGQLNPMRPENADGFQYEERMTNRIRIDTKNTGIFTLKFPLPFNYKTRYYQQLLTGETNAYISDLNALIQNEKNTKIRYYLRDQILDKHLTTCLLRLGEYIREQKLTLQLLTAPTPDTDNNRLSDIYVFHLLKACVARAYLEVQEMLAGVIVFRKTEEWLYGTLTKDTIPLTGWIVKRKDTGKTLTDTVSDGDKMKKQEIMQDTSYSTSEVTKVLDISEATLLRYKKDPKFPTPVLRGNKNFYSKAEIDNWKSVYRKK